MIRTQISVDEELYERARRVARRRGISLAALCREGLAEIVARTSSHAPWMDFAGILDGDPDDSENVDSIVYDRPTP